MPLRCHLRLLGRSPITKLIRHGSFVVPAEGFLAALHTEIAAAERNGSATIWHDTWVIDGPAGAVETTIDMHNTQFIAADRTEGIATHGYETGPFSPANGSAVAR